MEPVSINRIGSVAVLAFRRPLEVLAAAFYQFAVVGPKSIRALNDGRIIGSENFVGGAMPFRARLVPALFMVATPRRPPQA